MVQEAVTTTDAEEMDALSRARAEHLMPEAEPQIPADLQGAVQDARYILPMHEDPQWLPAWRLLDDERGEFGVPTRLPRGQWDQGGPNALMHQRRPGGGRAFSLVAPARVREQGKFSCFIGVCQKRMRDGAQLVKHVRTFHTQEAEAFKQELDEIDRMTVQHNPRFQHVKELLVADMTGTEVGADVFRCHEEGCLRFFDTKQGLAVHGAKEHRT